MRGGKRTGAGRPKGAKTKRTSAIAKEAARKGITPLEYMLDILRDETQEPSRRDEMAKAAAPFVHARLANTVIHADVKVAPKVDLVVDAMKVKEVKPE